MSILKRGCHLFLGAIMVFAALMLASAEVSAQEPMAAEAVESSESAHLPEPACYTGDDMSARIGEAYQGSRDVSGYWSFNGRCSTLVNSTVVALGLHDEYYSCNGSGIYDLYENMERSGTGYEVVRYDASEYDLEAALNAVSENGTRDVYNIIVGWQSGRTGASSAYGHTCFIYGIVDGMVYFNESFGLELNGRFYGEGKPIVCTIGEFAGYYNKWAYFEGLVHFDYPDEAAPDLSELETVRVSEDGFVLRFQASDNVGIADIYARVWRYGESEEDALTIPVVLNSDVASVRISIGDFENFIGRYYVKCYAVDRKGNVAEVATAEEGISLYEAETAAGVYRVTRDNTGVHNAPYVRVNGTNTRESVRNKGAEVTVVGSMVNDDGETWYLMAEGGWINGEYLGPVKQWPNVLEFLRELLGSMIP